jgi:hypothetical protein
MKFTIEGMSESFERGLLQLIADHRDELTITHDSGWTTDRAETYLRDLPTPARAFVRAVLDADGHKDADELRETYGSLKGPTISLTKALNRGVRNGWWPEGTPAPVNPLYDPDNPSWQRAIAYRLDRELVPIFRSALNRIDQQ